MTRTNPARVPGRPRSAQLDQTILAATLDELAELGYESMSIEGVATHAHVGKTTIYRRWPSKEALVLAAIQNIQAEVPIVDTGNLRADLLTMVQHALELGTSKSHFQKFASRAATELAARPEILRSLLMQVLPTRLHDFARLLERAWERGELRADLTIDVAMAMIAGPVYYYWLLGTFISSQPPPTNLAEQIVEAILYGLTGTR